MASLAATSSSLDTSTEEVEECTESSGLLTIISTGETQTQTQTWHLTNLPHPQVQRHWMEPSRCCSRGRCPVPASVSCHGVWYHRRSPLLCLQTPSALSASYRGLQTSDIQRYSSPARPGGESWAWWRPGPRSPRPSWTSPPLPWLRPGGLWRSVRLRLSRPASLALPAQPAPASQVALRVDEETKSFCQTLQRRSGG